jgi:hypothetical protein
VTPYDDDNIHDLFPPEPPPEPYDEPPAYGETPSYGAPPSYGWDGYDGRDRTRGPWWSPAEPWAGRGAARNRLTHVVLVDGRLVESWSEPVERSEWSHVAEWLDREARARELPPSAPRPLPHEEALAWLDSLVGGRVALEALSEADLPAVAEPDLEALPLASRHRLEAVTRALSTAAGELWDDEVHQALKAVLGALWSEVPDLVLRSKSPAHVAGGVCWVVGRANDLFGKERVTQQEVARRVGLTSALSGSGTSFHHALKGLQPPYGSRPWNQPDLIATGRPGFLLGATRRRLVRLRDQACEARDRHLADEERKRGVLP